MKKESDKRSKKSREICRKIGREIIKNYVIKNDDTTSEGKKRKYIDLEYKPHLKRFNEYFDSKKYRKIDDLTPAMINQLKIIQEDNYKDKNHRYLKAKCLHIVMAETFIPSTKRKQKRRIDGLKNSIKRTTDSITLNKLQSILKEIIEYCANINAINLDNEEDIKNKITTNRKNDNREIIMSLMILLLKQQIHGNELTETSAISIQNQSHLLKIKEYIDSKKYIQTSNSPLDNRLTEYFNKIINSNKSNIKCKNKELINLYISLHKIHLILRIIYTYSYRVKNQNKEKNNDILDAIIETLQKDFEEIENNIYNKNNKKEHSRLLAKSVYTTTNHQNTNSSSAKENNKLTSTNQNKRKINVTEKEITQVKRAKSISYNFSNSDLYDDESEPIQEEKIKKIEISDNDEQNSQNSQENDNVSSNKSNIDSTNQESQIDSKDINNNIESENNDSYDDLPEEEITIESIIQSIKRDFKKLKS